LAFSPRPPIQIIECGVPVESDLEAADLETRLGQALGWFGRTQSPA